jgi:hypothetical protein
LIDYLKTNNNLKKRYKNTLDNLKEGISLLVMIGYSDNHQPLAFTEGLFYFYKFIIAKKGF